MAKKKTDGPLVPKPTAVPNKDVIQRLNFLHQAANLMATTALSTHPITPPKSPQRTKRKPVDSRSNKGKSKSKRRKATSPDETTLISTQPETAHSPASGSSIANFAPSIASASSECDILERIQTAVQNSRSSGLLARSPISIPVAGSPHFPPPKNPHAPPPNIHVPPPNLQVPPLNTHVPPTSSHFSPFSPHYSPLFPPINQTYFDPNLPFAYASQWPPPTPPSKKVRFAPEAELMPLMPLPDGRSTTWEHRMFEGDWFHANNVTGSMYRCPAPDPTECNLLLSAPTQTRQTPPPLATPSLVAAVTTPVGTCPSAGPSASADVPLQSPALGLSRDLAKMMKAVAKKAVIRIDPSVKRQICKSCSALLVPGVTASIRNKASGPHHHVIHITCHACSHRRRIPAPPEATEADEGRNQSEGVVEGKRKRKRLVKAARKGKVFFEKDEHVVFQR